MVTRVADLTVEELRLLIRETVAQTLSDLIRDPDDGLEIHEDLRRELAEALAKPGSQIVAQAAADVAARLGLSW